MVIGKYLRRHDGQSMYQAALAVTLYCRAVNRSTSLSGLSGRIQRIRSAR
jgi:hypothetical protein